MPAHSVGLVKQNSPTSCLSSFPHFDQEGFGITASSIQKGQKHRTRQVKRSQPYLPLLLQATGLKQGCVGMGRSYIFEWNFKFDDYTGPDINYSLKNVLLSEREPERQEICPKFHPWTWNKWSHRLIFIYFKENGT